MRSVGLKEENCAECDAPTEHSLRSINRDIVGIFVGKNAAQSVEREMLKLAVLGLLGVGVLALIGYWGFFRFVADFDSKYALLAVYLLVGLIVNAAVVWHSRTYRNVSCQTGMMIGMTTGMLSGFLVGMIVAATNGMLVGSVAGLLVGIFIGSWAGKCCGIMGVLEGQMAGFMAGPMGAMTTIMLLVDHYEWFIPLALVFEVIMLAGLVFMVYKENNGQQLNIVKRTAKEDWLVFIVVTFAFWLVLVLVMVYGPKGLLTAV